MLISNMNNSNTSYYNIALSYEIPYNVFDTTTDQSKLDAKNHLFERLKGIVPQPKYEIFSIKLTVFQLRDTLNYIISFTVFFRSTEGLPMEEYVKARDVKDLAKKELEDFFSSIDCDYRQLNIKPLL